MTLIKGEEEGMNLELLYENEIIQIRLDQKHSCVECLLKKYNLSNDQIKASLEKVYKFVSENRCNKLLPILGDLSKAPKDIIYWAASEWFPQLVKSGIRTYAIVSPNSPLTQSINAKNPRVVNGVTTVYFDNVMKARSWVASLPN